MRLHYAQHMNLSIPLETQKNPHFQIIQVKKSLML